MAIFDVFRKKNKKEELDYDPMNLKITDLKKGFMLDYDLQTWTVTEEYEYDWGKGFFTKEFKINNGNETCFVHISDNDDISVSITKKVKIRTVSEDLPEHIMQNEAPPKRITYENVEYFLASENPGYFNNKANEKARWTEFISWEYYDKQEELIMSVEQWGEREFETSHGQIVNENEFTNILPV